jgi:transcriptional regulator with XRE-family HTH domain
MKERIIRIMKEKNMNASQFSDAIGIQRATISHILAGRNNPSLDMVMKILAKFPDISPDWLLSGKEPITRGFSKNTGNNNISNHPAEPVTSSDLFSPSDFPMVTRTDVNEQINRSGNLITTPAPPTEKPENHTGIHEKTRFTNEISHGEDVYNCKNRGRSEEREIEKETIVYKERPHKTIDKLLIFYSDNTFESFIPEKHMK